MSGGAYSDLKAAWHLDKIAALRSGKQIVPAQVQLILSDLCNQDCHFCLTDSALVDTLRGRRNITTIQVGDLVWGPDGHPQRVTATGSRSAPEVYRLRIGDSFLEASGEHPVLTQDGWKAARDIRVGDGAVVRVRVRSERAGLPEDLELVRRFASAKAWGFTPGEIKGFRTDESRQSDETSRSAGEGVCVHERKAQAAVRTRYAEHRRRCKTADAVGQEPDERPKDPSGGNGEGLVASDIQNGDTLHRFLRGEVGGYGIYRT